MNVLVVVAHPDDEILGVGGTWHKYNVGKDRVVTLIFSKGRQDPIDQHFEQKPITFFINDIEQVISTINPTIVFTHSSHDINKDHQIVNEAVKVACRPTKSNVKAVYGFDSTFSPFNHFKPSVFITLDQEDVDWKVEQMQKMYKKEMNVPYRTKAGILVQARYWGMQCNSKYAEAFEPILVIR